MKDACRACGGKRLFQSERIVARTILGPSPVVLTGIAETGVAARVCVDCGHIDLNATDLAGLKTTYAAREPLEPKA
jgi:hypothetical protein